MTLPVEYPKKANTVYTGGGTVARAKDHQARHPCDL